MVKSQFIVSVVLWHFLCAPQDLSARSWLPAPGLGSRCQALDSGARSWIPTLRSKSEKSKSKNHSKAAFISGKPQNEIFLGTDS
jgi:hypothetical protein